ncbi:SPFH domain-containing protein [Paenibacillus kandeliae]|uniref:SPFH domain-containing protein n=1 Tax=Paenibacillus kandeliae TaxID=3231269 RepID=UPI0034596CC2
MALVEVVKYDGTPDVYAWKYPNDELGTWTQLIVNESQEAILFKGGQAFDTFQAGRHTLSTMNIPLLNNIINLPFGGESPFAAEVWYINKVSNLDLKWGTNAPIQLQDPKYKIIIPVRAFGQMGIMIEDSRKFLIKLVGTLSRFDLSDISRYFRGVLLMNMNECISSYLVHRQISILDINAYISEISAFVKERMAPVFAEYGIRILNLFVDSVNTPDDDPSVKRLQEALARKAEMDIIGYTYQQERSFDTLEGAAKNEGSLQSGVMGAGLGLGMGFGIGGPLGQTMGQVSRVMDVNSNDVSAGAPATKTQPCHNCGQPLIAGSKFCHHCGDAYLACEHCGADNPEGAVNCHSCGKGLSHPCGQCGASLKAGAKFCHECGAPTSVTCSNCGQPMQPGQKFCMECGHQAPQQGGQA